MSFHGYRALRAAGAMLCLVLVSTALHAQGPWQAQPAKHAANHRETKRVYALDASALVALTSKRSGDTRLVLPLADGGFSDFALRDSGTLPPSLLARHPELRSLRGEDAHGRRVRLDVSPAGIDALIYADDGIEVIRPIGKSLHETFARKDAEHDHDHDHHAGDSDEHHCEIDGDDGDLEKALDALTHAPAQASSKAIGDNVRHRYRLALAATGEYTAAVCAPAAPGVSCGLAAMAKTINRVNEIYENDLSATLQLIDNNDLLVYTDGATDPYSNGDTSKLLDENQANFTELLGNAAYDIGHVFGTGNAGRAAINVTCKTGSKARGATGRGNPQGDAFDVDFVAHEIGHQFGANHTFNGRLGSCAGNNRVASVAFEPGSGSTVMGYAGICGAQNLQSHSDAYFHAASIAEMQAAIAADSCDVELPLANAVPVVDAGPARTIPARTPFVLRAQASDADGDMLTYSWEQIDLGPVQAGTDADGAKDGPLMRSYAPTPDPERSFPRLATLLGAAPAKGEVLPTTSRDMNFRVTVRDNHTGGGSSGQADVALKVVDTGAAFEITAPAAGDTLTCGGTFPLAWNPAGTVQAPIACPAVDVLLSMDGGVAFDRVLASAIPNNGSAQLAAPALLGSKARLLLRCSNNVFFDINDTDLVVADPGKPVAMDDTLAASQEGSERSIDAATLLGNDHGGSGALRLVAVGGAVGGTATLLDGVVRFVPQAQFTGEAGFDYSVADGCSRPDAPIASARVRFTVAGINKAPVLAAMADLTVTAQKGGSGTIPAFAKVEHFGAPGEAGQTVLGYVVEVVSDPDGVLAQIDIDPSGALFAAMAGPVGSATVSVRVRDSGGTAGGGIDLSEPRTFTFITHDHADLVVGINATQHSVAVGDTLQYVVTLENVGDEGIGGTHLLQSLPAGVASATWTCSASGAVCPTANGSGAIDLTLPMPPKGRFTFVVTGKVDGAAGATLLAKVKAEVAHDDGTTVAQQSDTELTDVVRGTQLFADGLE